ncbi:MAG TPA: hypothetical protein VKF81_16770 [Blastocatellia bacterium]|nr:hypothetical protein [Blastocatellia bacterium]
MNSLYNKRVVDVIASARKPWGDSLEQVWPLGITPFEVCEQTARTGP